LFLNRVVNNLNAELQEKLLEIKEQERARTLFFNNTSHELRTPIHGIIGYLEMIKREFKNRIPFEAVTTVDKAAQLANELKDLVNTILDISRFQRGALNLHVSTFKLDKLVDESEISWTV